MRRLTREIEARHVQRGTAKQKIIFDQASLNTEEHALWVKVTAWVMSVVMYLSPAMLLVDQTAHAAPIIDPRAPIPFQPTVTATSSGVPAINIPAPNSNGVSLGQYQSFNVGPEGLVLNNSTLPGTPLLGGSLGANPNLNGRPASLIINQVTSNNISVLNGPLETFGAAAPIVIAAPGGISANGLSLTNIPNLTLTTGTPQFITGVGGSPTDFAHAGAVAYDVRSGNISINGPAGVNGPGAGIEGTVGNIDLIGQTVTLAAPIRADQRINVVTGNQLVTPTTTGNTGTAYGTAANGLPNNVTAIQTANGLAIDANQFGSVTAGQVYIVQTAAGLGANMQGPLTATAGHVVVNSNGDVTVGQTFASQNVNLTSAGNTTISGTGLANQNYTVAANGDITAPGAVSAGQSVSMTAGRNLTAASVAANGSANLTAGESMAIDSLSAHDIALRTTNGDLTVGGLSAPGTISAQAGRDLTVKGAVQGGSTVALAGARNATVNGAVTSVGDTNLTATTGSAAVSGNLQSNGAATVTAGQDATIDGTTQAHGAVSIAAQAGSISGQGKVSSSQGAITLDAGRAIGLNGAVQSGATIAAKAGTNADFGGTVTAPGAVTIQSGQNSTLGGDVTSGDKLSVTSGGSTHVNGNAASVGDMMLTANGGTVSTTGNVVSLGGLNATGQQGVNLGGTVYSGGNASIGSSAGSVSVAGAVSTPGTVNIAAAQDATVAGTVQTGQSTTISAGRDANLNGGLSVNNTGNATVSAGRDINGTGAVNVANDTTLNAGNNIGISGAIRTGNNLKAKTANNLSVGVTTAVGTTTLTATNGSATLAGNALSGGATTITAGTDVTTQGSVTSLGDLSVNAKDGNVTASGPISTAGNASLNASKNLTLNGQTTVSKDGTLTAANITTQGVSIGGNLTATATSNLDTSAGQLNAVFDAQAPALSVNGNATLSGANVTTANAVVGGTTQITGSQSVTTGGTAAFKGDTSLNGGTVSNVGTQMAGGNLNVSGSTVTNSGSLSSLKSATFNAANLSNGGSIYAPTANFNVSNATTNTGALMATNALNLTTSSLSNAGLIFAGDVNNSTAATGDTTVTVTGGNGSFNNTNGKILAQNIATLALPNQALDPSAASYGTVNGGYGLNLSAQSVNNSGTWILPGTTVTVSAAQGINNAGTINQGAGSLTLNGAVGNTGAINGNDLTINGSLANAATGTVTANNALTLNGSGSNAGTVQAANTLAITGASYDNSGGTTRAGNANSPAGSGNATINLSGDLGNAGGTLTATNDLSLTANNVNNSAASVVTTTTTTKTVDNPGLLMATPIGSELVYAIYNVGKDGGTLMLGQANLPATLGGLLSPGGEQPTKQTVWSLSSVRLIYQGWGDPSSPVASSGPIQFALVPTSNAPKGAIWVVVPPSTPVSGATTVQTLTLPTVTETTTSTGATVTPSTIAAGHDLTLTANTLNNQSGVVSAGHDANVNVPQLQNGGSSFTSTVTDSVDSASLNAFLTSLQALQKTAPIGVAGTANPSGTYQCEGGYCLVGTPTPPATYTISAPGTVQLETVSSSVTKQGAVGQIIAGNNLNLSGGNLTNTGTLAAGNDVNIQAASFTNQGSNVGSKAVTAGCASGVSNAGCSSLNTTNPNSETYSYQQTNSNVTAGHDIVIAANQVANTYGNLVARNDIVIGGAGTTAANSMQAMSVTNTSAAIEAGNNIQINAASVTNTIAAPVAVHQNYGTASPYTGCGQNCEAYIQVQAANPSTITANNNLSISAGTFSNTGSLVTALNNATINASTSASSDNQYLHAFWTGNPGATRTWGCLGMAADCQNLYGGAFSQGDTQAASGLPSNVGMKDFVPGTIQAGNLNVHSPTLTNTGNVIGQSITLTGSTLVNGITNPNVFTPPPVVSGQVISLAPPTLPPSVAAAVNQAGLVTNQDGRPTSVTGMAALPPNTPIGAQTVGKPTAPIVTGVSTPTITTVKTVSGQTVTVSYLTSNPAAQVVDSLSSASLIANLPANLQPGSVPFYYDPYTENQQIQQAALQATGKSSFYSTPSATDSTSQASINNQDKAALYGAALEYAKQNNIALGTQLSDAQLAQINAPMLWYVQQAVPEPGCQASGGAACPTVQALMPEVLLPKNYAVVNADGEITGTNVALNYANSILNTGSVTAQNLTVNTGSLTNEQRSTNIGEIYQFGDEGVFLRTTGTVAQQGGFMSAANYDLHVQSLNQIGGALQQTNADGSVNQAATQQMLSNLKAQLGGQFSQSTVTDHLNTEAVYGDSWFDQIFMTGVIVGLSIMGGMAASGAIGAAAGASAGSGSAFAAAGTTAGSLGAGTANAALSAGFAGMMNSTMSQLNSGGSFSLGSMLTTAGAAALTAGLTNGITFSNGAAGWSWTASNNSLAALAGVQTVGNTLVPQAGAATGSLPTTITAIAAESVLQATVQTALQGGSFLTNLRNSAATNAAASIAYTIGNLNQDGTLTGAAYVAAHAALGCAAGAATGQGCGGGAIGGAVSAALTPDVLRVIDPSGAALDQGQMAMLAAISTWAGGGIAGVAGQNAMAGATAAQNEALNNDAGSPSHTAAAVKNGGAISSAIDLALAVLLPWKSATVQNLAQPITSTVKGVGSLIQANNGQTPPADPNPLVQANEGNPPATGGAVVTPPTVTCFPGVGCVITPPIASPGAAGSPSNVSLSSGDNDGSGSGTGGQVTPNSGKISIDDARAGHIFRDSEGHISDTPANRQLLENVANDPSAILGTDKYGTTWAAKLNPDGTQTWVGIRGGSVSYGGINQTPKSFNQKTGLASPTKPGK
ncbi:filamentous hemagglutinin N-terminal domain-containing protein [Burkholderia cenocepacia]|uniref:two-partner secretion domain-containing protein n=1 Tax=Burkholderia cenocepacia TaxID=95486 RepID=UPI0015898FE6|nr:filamentous hemagglutinin N-terminal domain-containing protein [Burkholderia cenocepacia]MBR7956543.1 filamentous hemagglutinin N-terminal domain-containing protein [Burkholderia cenocepacia]